MVARNTVHSLCREAGIIATVHRRRGSGKKAGPPVHDDHVNRVFAATKPDQVWLTDITEHWTGTGKLYLCAIKDVFSNRIIGYAIDGRMTSSLAVAALEQAVARRALGGADLTDVTCHSDRGSQFRSRNFVSTLNRHGIRGSMGRVGAAGDNAAMESFFSLLQKNVLNKKRWDTREELRIAIITWIERTYHRRRRQDRLGRMTPIEFETVYAQQTMALAA